jgi:heat shock protein HslJ
VQVKSASVADGRIHLELVEAGPDDAVCCPSLRTRSEWALTDAGLERVATDIQGTLSLADLAGGQWILRELGRGRDVPDDVVITIAFEDGRVAGSGGCNRYFAEVSSDAPGALAFSATGTTMMACPDPAMELEGRYLATLAGASSYSFQGGRLVLGCDADEGPTALVFAPVEEER